MHRIGKSLSTTTSDNLPVRRATDGLPMAGKTKTVAKILQATPNNSMMTEGNATPTKGTKR